MIGEGEDLEWMEIAAQHCRELRKRHEQILEDIDSGNFTSASQELLKRGEQICEDPYGAIHKVETGKGLLRFSKLFLENFWLFYSPSDK